MRAGETGKPFPKGFPVGNGFPVAVIAVTWQPFRMCPVVCERRETNPLAYARAVGTIRHVHSYQSAGVCERRENNPPRAQLPIRWRMRAP